VITDPLVDEIGPLGPPIEKATLALARRQLACHAIEGSVGVGADSSHGRHHDQQNHREHKRVFSDILTRIIVPKSPYGAQHFLYSFDVDLQAAACGCFL
jgi:hypothetical protein